MDSQEVSIDIYAKCLNYTMQCKIAPLWNKVGQYYVHGMKFYIITEEFDALRVKIVLNGTVPVIVIIDTYMYTYYTTYIYTITAYK